MAPTCYLKSVQDAKKRINLPHDTPILIGRNEDTAIEDLFVSRNHLQCIANINSRTVSVKTLGKSHSGCNGFALMKNETYDLKNGDVIEVRLGFHGFEIIFEPDEDTPEPPAKKQKIADFFNVKPQAKVVGKWEEVDGRSLLIYSPDNCLPQTKIAAFDMDGTIIKTKSGARFPKDPSDWVLNFDNIARKIQKLYEDKYKVVFFTNQSGLGNDSGKIKGFKGKIEAIVGKLGVPIQVFIATGRTIYRKPATGMWDYLVKAKNGDAGVDLSECFYVGDAAGRGKNWAPSKKKDHSKADRLFALNLGVKFYTPEEYFLGASAVGYDKPEFDPRKLPDGVYEYAESDEVEVVLMVGGPGSGKSFFCRSQLIPKGYVHVSRDKLGSWQKCVKMLGDCLEKGQKVVIDNTNSDKEKRQRFVEVAKKFGVPCRCFVMSTSYKHAKHNNRFREITDKSHVPVGDIILHSYKKSYQEPDLEEEGFAEIIKIPFVPRFDKEEHAKLYKMFLIED